MEQEADAVRAVLDLVRPAGHRLDMPGLDEVDVFCPEAFKFMSS